jgi:hypothetical protein
MKSGTKYKCVCGYIFDGEAAPAKCPKCGAPAERFTKLDEAAANLVEGARRTNMCHSRIISLAREIEGICKEGIADALDPGCVDVFQKTLAASYDMMKLSMTEMQGHMSKGKWG